MQRKKSDGVKKSTNSSKSETERVLWDDELSPEIVNQLYNFLKRLRNGNNNYSRFTQTKKQNNNKSGSNNIAGITKIGKRKIDDVELITPTSLLKKARISSEEDEKEEKRDGGILSGLDDVEQEEDYVKKKEEKIDKGTSLDDVETTDYGNISKKRVSSFIDYMIKKELITKIDNDLVSNGNDVVNIKDFVRSVLMPNKNLSQEMVQFITKLVDKIPLEYMRNKQLIKLITNSGYGKNIYASKNG